ncbi:hypothetical protein, partial [Xenorhabdus sp. SGI240]|uniref:hypothetical protein n=1 Tax=Xenorhabdus sp. SGI240 TaxID=3158262 RepID=UPI0032B80B9B
WPPGAGHCAAAGERDEPVSSCGEKPGSAYSDPASGVRHFSAGPAAEPDGLDGITAQSHYP